jgi:hypothetical protein
MSNKVSFVLNRDPPYMDTTVPYERTKAEIEILLKSYWIKNIRWTTLEGEDDTLEFIIEAKVEGVKKQLGVEVKPPHIVIKKKLHANSSILKVTNWLLSARISLTRNPSLTSYQLKVILLGC